MKQTVRLWSACFCGGRFPLSPAGPGLPTFIHKQLCAFSVPLFHVIFLGVVPDILGQFGVSERTDVIVRAHALDISARGGNIDIAGFIGIFLLREFQQFFQFPNRQDVIFGFSFTLCRRSGFIARFIFGCSRLR